MKKLFIIQRHCLPFSKHGWNDLRFDGFKWHITSQTGTRFGLFKGILMYLYVFFSFKNKQRKGFNFRLKKVPLKWWENN